MQKAIARVLNRLISPLGIKLVKLNSRGNDDFDDLFVDDYPQNRIIDVYKLSHLSEDIRGMIDARAGEELFSLAYMQALAGDVVEVGSFQGRSTFFLGAAVRASRNGHLYAIDHFKGNKGKEHFYVVGSKDLSDLEGGFRRNIQRAGLSEVVTLFNEPNHQAAAKIADQSVRLLFIDGDHTAQGVAKDLELFLPKLRKDAIIVFDDYDRVDFKGLVDEVNRFVARTEVKRKYLLGRTLVVQL